MTEEIFREIENNPKKFLVIGDVMLDKYCMGTIERISPEAPVPVMRYQKEKNILGGAANVAANLIGIGQKVSLMACVGKDVAGEVICNQLKTWGIDAEMVMTEAGRPTTVKTRYVAGNQQLLRVDDEDTSELQERTIQNLLEIYERRIDEFDLILISDYMKGVLSEEFTQKLIHIADAHKKKVIVDVKDRNMVKYKGTYLLKPNRKELGELSGMPVETMEQVVAAMHILQNTANSQCVLTTLSADGMALLDENGKIVFEKSEVKKVYDVVGAGDTAFAYIAVAIAFALESSEVLRIANTASSLKVTRFGTSVIKLSEVAAELYGMVDKVQAFDKIEETLNGLRHKKIVFTNGCFDILHIGHIRYLKEAKNKGDILVLGLNSDESVKRLKGPTRPVNCQQDRIDMLAEMEFIDYIVVFEQDTPLELIQKVKPDVLVKGGDYQVDSIVGADFVRARGGSVEVIPFVEGKSTTNIINLMRY